MKRHFGHVDTIVNNAGIMGSGFEPLFAVALDGAAQEYGPPGSLHASDAGPTVSVLACVGVRLHMGLARLVLVPYSDDTKSRCNDLTMICLLWREAYDASGSISNRVHVCCCLQTCRAAGGDLQGELLGYSACDARLPAPAAGRQTAQDCQHQHRIWQYTNACLTDLQTKPKCDGVFKSGLCFKQGRIEHA